MINKWTEEEITYIKNNYINLGIKVCALTLKRTNASVAHKALRLGIKNHKKHINMNHFYEIILPEISYFLGILWADGYIDDKYTTGLTLVKTDMDELKHILDIIGEWSEYVRIPQNNSHKIISMQRITNKEFHDFLLDNEFNNKSVVSPSKILAKIPIKLHMYFWRGFFDGDGCIHIQKNPRHNFGSLTLTGSYNQDWKNLRYCLDNLSVQHQYKQTVSVKKHSCSRIIISNKIGILRFGNYIYGEINFPIIGLSRKYKIFEDFKNKEDIFSRQRLQKESKDQ